VWLDSYALQSVPCKLKALGCKTKLCIAVTQGHCCSNNCCNPFAHPIYKTPLAAQSDLASKCKASYFATHNALVYTLFSHVMKTRPMP
jgi:hypothetical protein